MFNQLYRPKSFSELSYNPNVTQKLQNINFQNFVIYGPKGSGKSTRVDCYLNHIFDENIYKKKIHVKSINKNLEIVYKSSNYHIEINLSNYGNNDRLIITDFLYTLAYSPNIITNGLKIFVIKDADRLSNKAQNTLRNLMETSYKTSRFVFICNNIVKLIEPLRSRLLLIRNSCPNIKEIHNIIKDISIKTNIKISTRAVNIIIENSLKLSNIINLNSVINIFQMSYITGKYSKYDIQYITYLDQLINIIEKQEIDYNKIRELIYIIYVSNIDKNIIFNYLLKYFIKNIKNDKYKYEIINYASKYQYLILLGNKDPLYIETFIYHIIKVLKYNDIIKTKTIKIKKKISNIESNIESNI